VGVITYKNAPLATSSIQRHVNVNENAPSLAPIGSLSTRTVNVSVREFVGGPTFSIQRNVLVNVD